MHTVTKDEYYDYVLRNSEFHTPSCDVSQIPQSAIKLYNFMSDFKDRRGLRQNWESYLSDDKEKKLMNELHKAIIKTKFDDKEKTVVLMDILKKVPGNNETFSSIDFDIMEEIKQTWFDIVK